MSWTCDKPYVCISVAQITPENITSQYLPSIHLSLGSNFCVKISRYSVVAVLQVVWCIRSVSCCGGI